MDSTHVIGQARIHRHISANIYIFKNRKILHDILIKFCTPTNTVRANVKCDTNNNFHTELRYLETSKAIGALKPFYNCPSKQDIYLKKTQEIVKKSSNEIQADGQ
jgi:hypothetical protein